MYKCGENHVFETPELLTLDLVDRGEELYGCPICGEGFDKVYECTECGAYFDGESDEDLCNECLEKAEYVDWEGLRKEEAELALLIESSWVGEDNYNDCQRD